MIPTSAAEPVQRAFYSLMAADTVLTVTLGFAVVDDTRERVYPYIAIGAGTESPDNAHNEFGSNLTQDIDIWTKDGAWTPGNRALARIRQLLDHQRPDLGAEHRCVSCRFETAARIRDPREPFPRHIAATFRVVTTQTT
jgi:hypothetical protein